MTTSSIGYRVFEWASDGRLRGPYTGAVFPSGRIPAGRCPGKQVIPAAVAWTGGHIAPHENCTCGFRAAPELRDAVDHMAARCIRTQAGGRIEDWEFDENTIWEPIAQVKLSGRCLPGEAGDHFVFDRWEYLEITKVYLPRRTPMENVIALRNYYGSVSVNDSTVLDLFRETDPGRWGCVLCAEPTEEGTLTCEKHRDGQRCSNPRPMGAVVTPGKSRW
ncbi:hypothetical protein [Qaidamihabitans albus]|uniref:hypothetical protein n=1 Tax=Qaidamihabitans albus TaxID=2795733 RepID=UPI0018F229E3|nr:hypothetical protein [Qaidamihabitans albus]